MQESMGNTEAKSNIDSYSQHDEIDQQDDDTDADAFAILSLLLIIAATTIYYLGA